MSAFSNDILQRAHILQGKKRKHTFRYNIYFAFIRKEVSNTNKKCTELANIKINFRTECILIFFLNIYIHVIDILSIYALIEGDLKLLKHALCYDVNQKCIYDKTTNDINKRCKLNKYNTDVGINFMLLR